MTHILLILALFAAPDTGYHKFSPADTTSYVSPLAPWSKEWNDPKYAVCNTAANVSYMNDTEKEVIYILNLVRINPALFCETVLKPYPKLREEMEHYTSSGYFTSLVNTLSQMQPVNILYPDSLCFVSADCHAIQSGKAGYTGHDRTKECAKLQHLMGECCDYGFNNPLDILMDLLIDEDVPTLGHREICLSLRYDKIGVSIQPHTTYRYNTVMDFY